MTPREKAVVRAIAKALHANPKSLHYQSDMDALALSYELPSEYASGTVAKRAALLLIAMTEQPS